MIRVCTDFLVNNSYLHKSFFYTNWYQIYWWSLLARHSGPSCAKLADKDYWPQKHSFTPEWIPTNIDFLSCLGSRIILIIFLTCDLVLPSSIFNEKELCLVVTDAFILFCNLLRCIPRAYVFPPEFFPFYIFPLPVSFSLAWKGTT